MEGNMSTETATTVSRVDTIASNLDQFFLIVMGCLIFCKYFSDYILKVLFLPVFHLLSHDFNFSEKFLKYSKNLNSLLTYFRSCLNNHDSV